MKDFNSREHSFLSAKGAQLLLCLALGEDGRRKQQSKIVNLKSKFKKHI
jgi:hypothetical protein